MAAKICSDLIGTLACQQLLAEYDTAAITNIAYELHYEKSVGKTSTDLARIVRDKQFGFGHALFDDTRKIQEEQDGFIENPFDVADGIFTCGKCGGTRTYSYAKQVRSCDEGMSMFVTCVKCKNKWMHSG